MFNCITHLKQWLHANADVTGRRGEKRKISIRNNPLQRVSGAVSYGSSYTVCKQVNKRAIEQERGVCYLTCTVFSFSVCSVEKGLLARSLKQVSVSG